MWGTPPAEHLTAEEPNGGIVVLFTERLDRSRPLWRMDVLGPTEDGAWRPPEDVGATTRVSWIYRSGSSRYTTRSSRC